MRAYKRPLTSYWFYTFIVLALAFGIYALRLYHSFEARQERKHSLWLAARLYKSSEAQLQHNHSLWLAAHIKHYSYTLETVGMFPVIADVEIRNNQEVKFVVKSGELENSKGGKETVESYFDWIQSGLDEMQRDHAATPQERPFHLDVGYNARYGYPTHVSWINDPFKVSGVWMQGTDGETGMRISNFKALN